MLIGVRAGDLLDEALSAAGVTGVAATLVETGAGREIARWGSGSGSVVNSLDVELAGHAWQVRVSPLSPGTPGRTAAAHTIAGFTELLIEDAGDGLDSDSRAYLDRIAGGSRRMLEVVGGLTSYTSSHRTELDLRPLDTTALARGVAAGRLDAAAGPRPSVDVADLPPVMADPQLLGDVLGHLLDNALRFVRHGETPRVSVRAAAHSPAGSASRSPTTASASPTTSATSSSAPSTAPRPPTATRASAWAWPPAPASSPCTAATWASTRPPTAAASSGSPSPPPASPSRRYGNRWGVPRSSTQTNVPSRAEMGR